MPELVEVEIYRRSLDRIVGSVVSEVSAPDSWYLKGATTPKRLRDAIVGSTVMGTRRRGKLLLVDVDSDRAQISVGLRFGMTGRLCVDGEQPIGELLYSTNSNDERFVRFGFETRRGGDGGPPGGHSVSIIDPRRLGGVELDPDETRLGPDAATVSSTELAAALSGRREVKAVLLDQSRLAGVGNLICDETLWRAGISPVRRVDTFGDGDVDILAGALRSTITDLTRRGGSHTGDLQHHRHREGCCPRDGGVLIRSDVGGRTTYWCPTHQS